MKKAIALCLLAAICLSFCACGKLYDKEYVSIEDYVAPAQEQSADIDKRISVKNLSELKRVLRSYVTSGETEGVLEFSESYSGNPTDDLADACWQIRSQDALCAYCVENISYELSHLLGTYEAKINLIYADTGVALSDIHQTQLSSDVDHLIDVAIRSGDDRLVVLVNNSSNTSADIADYVSSCYRKNPDFTPREPKANVAVYSGSGLQKLYDIKFNYGVSAEDFALQTKEIKKLFPFNANVNSWSDYDKALEAYTYLFDNCELSDSGNSAYDALILNTADSEGIALGYVVLCKKLGLDCIAVYGQFERENKCWNIVEINGQYYHVDITAKDIPSFLCNDEAMWGNYRWDMSSYPACNGILLID